MMPTVPTPGLSLPSLGLIQSSKVVVETLQVWPFQHMPPPWKSINSFSLSPSR